MAIDLQDKPLWCAAGEKSEETFAQRCFAEGIGVVRNITKVLDSSKGKYATDMFALLPADLKSVKTPFFTAAAYGFDPATTITLNLKDIEHYRKRHPAMLLFFDVHWDEQTQYGVYVPTVHTLRLCLLPSLLRWIDAGHAKIHDYQQRVNDNKGNAKSSYVLNFSWFWELSDEPTNHKIPNPAALDLNS